MLSFVVYSTIQEERRLLLEAVRNIFARYTEQDLICIEASNVKSALESIEKNEISLLGWDVRSADALEALEQYRQQSRNAFLLVIADSKTSPLSFLKPSIAPDTLVICPPLEKKETERVAAEMMEAVKRSTADTARFFIENRNEKISVPYDQIYCFEARDRRLYACLRHEEIGFAGTLEELEKQLPSSFWRVHRAFIVNSEKIERVQLTESLIKLKDGISVPLSRSYKKVIREKIF